MVCEYQDLELFLRPSLYGCYFACFAQLRFFGCLTLLVVYIVACGALGLHTHRCYDLVGEQRIRVSVHTTISEDSMPTATHAQHMTTSIRRENSRDEVFHQDSGATAAFPFTNSIQSVREDIDAMVAVPRGESGIYARDFGHGWVHRNEDDRENHWTRVTRGPALTKDGNVLVRERKIVLEIPDSRWRGQQNTSCRLLGLM